MTEVLKHTVEYLEKTIPNFVKNRDMFTCPDCLNKMPSCSFISDEHPIMDCKSCGFNEDLIMFLERKLNLSPEKVVKHIIDTLNLNITTGDELERLLNIYQQLGFDLVPITKNGKAPVEKDWTNKNHKDKKEWEMWLDRGLNIGVKTGKISNITVIDVDTKTIPKLLADILTPTFKQETKKGAHYFYKYTPDLPKTRIDSLKVDIENDGGQVVIAPSIVEDWKREINTAPIAPFPPALKQYFLDRIKSNGSFTSQVPDTILTNVNLDSIPDGARHHLLMKLGGLFRNHLNMAQTTLVLDVLNKFACKPSLSKIEFDAITRSLAKYDNFDEKDLAQSVLRYLNIVEEATARDVKDALGFPKEKIDKVLSYLCKEDYLFRKSRMYHMIKKADWKDTWSKEHEELSYIFPYLSKFGKIRNGDLIIIGGKSGTGKTHIAMNIVKHLVDQNVKPYYISLESGNRFSLIAEELFLKEGDFNWCVHFNPENIEIEPNSVTLLDWLLPKDYASTDKTYEHFARQLAKQGGVLVVFCQLKGNGDFFAEDMIKFFPSMAIKFLYETDQQGLDDRMSSYFLAEKIREPYTHQFRPKIPCKYDPSTKLLTEVG